MNNVDAPALGVIFSILVIGIVLYLTARKLRRTRPGFNVTTPLAIAFGLRLLAVVGLNATGMGESLRGGDEQTFLYYARQLAAQPLGHGDLPHGVYQLHVLIFALQMKLGFLNVTALRVTQIGFALLGALLVMAVVYNFGGARAARIAAWILALEPSSIFFASELHRESLIEFGTGLVLLGGTWIWQRLDIRGIFVGALGALIVIETRSYAGWFMAAGLVMILLHASLRNITVKSRALPIVFAIIVMGLVATPTVLTATSGHNLKHLQESNQANAAGTGYTNAAGTGPNLKLEAVDYSSRGAVITSLPTKVSELVLQPYPWQVADSSQAFGALGTLFVYVLLLLLIRVMWLNRGHIFDHTGPLLYVLFTQTVAYALVVGNAGTGFRYRAHLTTLMIACFAILYVCMQTADAEVPESVNNETVAAHPRQRIVSAT